jgi:hypothetical protein
MTRIDNFETVEDLMLFDSTDDFYFVQIIKRRKENPDMKKGSIIINSYYIRDNTHLDLYKGEIRLLCDYHKARAYISINKRSFKKSALGTMEKLCNQILSEDYNGVRRSYDSVCGSKSNAKGKKRWIIDVDIKGHEGVLEVREIIEKIPPDNYILTVPTKNGYHMIVKPFDLKKYTSNLKDIDNHDICKDGFTLLYFPWYDV